MSLVLKAKKEEYANLRKEATALLNVVETEKRSLNDAESKRWEVLEPQMRALAKEIDQLQSLNDLPEERKEEEGKKHADKLREDSEIPDVGVALNGWVRQLRGVEPTDIQKRAASAYKFGTSPEIEINMDGGIQQRALATTSVSTGGSVVRPGFIQAFEQQLKAFGGLRKYAQVIRTTAGEPMLFSYMDDTANLGYIVGQNASVGFLDPSFSQQTFGAYKYTSGIVLLPTELLEDSSVDISSIIAEACATRIGRGQAAHFISGTGSSQPRGLFASSGGVPTILAASPTVFTWQELIKLKYSVDPAYRVNGKWIVSDNAAYIMKTMVDSTGRPIWNTNLSALGTVNTFDGDEVLFDNNMAAAGVSTVPVAYGDPSYYTIRDVRGIRIRRLVERYADYDQEGIVAFLRTDAGLRALGAIKGLKMAAS